jgi:monoamine oxidase
MEEYWESNPAVKILKELKLPLKVESSASSIVLNQKLEILGPNESIEDFLTRILTPVEKAAFDSFRAQVGPMIQRMSGPHPFPKELMNLKDIALSEWVLQQNLPKRVSEWIRISVECEIGTQWEQLSALDGISEFHIFLGKGESSYRVIGGNERFTQALAKFINPQRISLNERVTRVESKKGQVYISVLNQVTHQNRRIEAKAVVSTIPLYRLSELQFDPPLSDKKWEAIRTQTWGSYFKAHVFISRTANRSNTTKKVNALPILSDSDLGVIYDGNPDQKTSTQILSLLITGHHAEKFTMMPMDEVKKQIMIAFDQLWPEFSKEIQGMEFYRYHPRAIAGWPVGRSRFDELSDELRMPENQIYLAGDFTEGTHSSGAFESASRVTRQLISVLKRGRK